MFVVNTTLNLGDQSVKRVHLVPHVSGIQCGRDDKANIEKRTTTVSDSCKRRFKCGHTFIDDLAMLQLLKIAMAYRQELVASPVIKTSAVT